MSVLQSPQVSVPSSKGWKDCLTFSSTCLHLKLSGWGRAHGKFSELIKHIQELPWCKLRLEDLSQLAASLKSSFDPYGKHFAFPKSQTDEADPKSHHCGNASGARSTVGAMQVQFRPGEVEKSRLPSMQPVSSTIPWSELRILIPKP